jgi:DNA end-binding protein Ku
MPRAMWSGSISFGLVNVPVKLYPAVSQKEVHFHMLTQDGQCRIRRKLVCGDTGEEVDYKDTTRGYEIAPDEYVTVTDEELAALKPEASRTIDITDFVELSEIDPIYFERPYYLAPDNRAEKAYHLLWKAMRDSGKVGLAKFVMRQKEYLCAIRPTDKLLMLETMNYADEINRPDEIPGVDARPKIEDKQLKMARQLIDALSGDFEPGKYKDTYRGQVLKMIEQKAEGKEITLAPEPREPARAVNLMKALEASIAEAKRSRTAAGRHAGDADHRSRGPHRDKHSPHDGAHARRKPPARSERSSHSRSTHARSRKKSA